jgi:hypothetical protein
MRCGTNKFSTRSKRMKKTFLVLTVLAILSVMIACTKTTAATETAGTTATLSGQAELLVGTFKLEDTDLAVTADQARQLLPLWQTLQALSISSTAATEEINAVVNQIKSTMTTQQIARITELNLTQQDIMTVMRDAGVAQNNTGASTTPMAMGNFPSGGAQGGGGMPSGGQGGMPSGGMPSGGGAAPSGGDGFVVNGDFPAGGDPGMAGGPNASTTPQAVRPNMGNQLPVPLLNALIQLLQEKVK